MRYRVFNVRWRICANSICGETYTDEAYRQERVALERQIKLVSPPTQPRQLPNLERAAELLKNLPVLWSHSGVTDEQRESFLREVFAQITIDGKQITAIEPKPTYSPLFATMPLNQNLDILRWSLPRLHQTEIFRLHIHDGAIGLDLYWPKK